MEIDKIIWMNSLYGIIMIMIIKLTNAMYNQKQIISTIHYQKQNKNNQTKPIESSTNFFYIFSIVLGEPLYMDF